jgi:uncharacterized protein YdeI (YjbR/CyaY-like superfamily)
MAVALTFFETPAKFRAWLQKHHKTAAELWVGFYKKATGKPSITWQEAVDEALCFGWIDGIRKSVDAESYTNRFTPRRRGSVWSAVNTRRAVELIKEGRMRAAGKGAFAARDAAKTDAVSRVRDAARLEKVHEAKFKANGAAWEFFSAQPPGYRRMAAWWVLSAKRNETQARRLATLIQMSASGQRLVPIQPADRRA